MPKRAHDVVDLTGDDESETRQKRPATGSSIQRQHQSQSYPGQGGTSVYGGSSSQNVPSSTAEPDYLDLTQDDEGPPLELYGTFRMLHSYVILYIMTCSDIVQMERLLVLDIMQATHHQVVCSSLSRPHTRHSQLHRSCSLQTRT